MLNLQWITNPLKKLLKRKSFWVILAVIIIAVLILMNMTGSKKIQYVTDKVKKGKLTQTVSETGTIESASAIDLNFKNPGTLAELDVKEGAEVKAKDVLARLDAGSLEIQVKQAQANVDIAAASLNRLLAGSSKEDIKVSQESVNNARIAYDNATNDYDNLRVKLEADLNTYQANVSASQTALDNAKNTYAKSRADARQTLLTSIRSKADAANTSLDFINYQFTNKGNVADEQSKNNTWYYYEFARDKQTSLKNLLNKSDQAMSDDDVNQAVSLSIGMFEDINTSLNSLFNTIVSTVVDSRYSQTLIDNAKALVKAEQTNASANLAALQAADQSYKTAQLAYTSAVDSASATLANNQNTLNSASANKDVQIQQVKASVDSALGAYNLAQAQLDLKKAPARTVDLNYYQAQVNQAKAAKDLALNNLKDYTIYAPTDGIITFINYKIGEQISFGGTSNSTISKPAISMLGLNDFQIKVDVPESDIVKVKVSNPVKITLDAYGSGIEFTGKVIYIDVAETVISDVVYYKVTVALDKTDLEIKSGMTANVDIQTAQKDDVLYVPNRAIKETETGQKYVEILKFGSPVKVNISVGLKGDQGTEVQSGLNEGQEIIIYSKQQ
ncbi:MAG: efflux RND transporter periplasmic adaptor subunit [Candidatus Parcubacteria bacterium]|nr:efflux RND transporter periplasmic adaptor subunit [Candidatus Parcubacteria bacterium]